MRKSLLSLLVLFVYSLVAFAQEGAAYTQAEPATVAPTRLVSVTPTMTEELTALPERVVFTFENDVQEVTSVRLRHNGWGGMRIPDLVGEEGVVVTDGKTVTVNVPASLVQGKTQMSLTLMGTAVDGGALADGENDEQVVVQYQYTPNPARYVFTEANPANSSTVRKLETIVVTFQHPAEGQTGGFAKDVVLKVLDANANEVTTATIGLDMANNDGYNNNALITLDEPVTANGTYTITVPEATVFDNKYNAWHDDYGVAEFGAIYNPEFTLTYTVEAYPINFDKEAYQTGGQYGNRILNSISLTAGSGEVQTATLDGTKKAYQDLTNQTFTIVNGDEVTVRTNYSGSWMHTYVYIDLDNDNQFSFNNGADQTGTELLGWTYIAGYNNEGVTVSETVDPNSPMKFTVNAEPGEYRMRVKVDWDNQDPGGNVASNNHILNNGGHIVDVTLVVTAGTGINAATLDKNAKVYTLDGRRVIVNGKLNRGFYIINGQKTFVK